MEKLNELWQEKPKLVVLTSLLSLLVVGGIVFLLIARMNNPKQRQELNQEAPAIEWEAEIEQSQESPLLISYADIKGAVQKPGMYQVPTEARVLDVVQLAGGFTDEAETVAVNFSERVTDQMVIYIPKIGEEPPLKVTKEETEPPGTQVGKININTATQAELEQLSGIGPSKAQQIIGHREEHGSFKSIAEIKNVKGFGEKTFESLKISITID